MEKMVLGSRKGWTCKLLMLSFVRCSLMEAGKTCSSGWREADLEARRVSESESGTNQTSVPCWPYSIQAVAYCPAVPVTGTLPGTRSPAPCKNSFGFIIHFSCVSDGCRFSGPSVRGRAPESCSDALQSCGSGKFWENRLEAYPVILPQSPSSVLHNLLQSIFLLYPAIKRANANSQSASSLFTYYSKFNY